MLQIKYRIIELKGNVMVLKQSVKELFEKMDNDKKFVEELRQQIISSVEKSVDQSSCQMTSNFSDYVKYMEFDEEYVNEYPVVSSSSKITHIDKKRNYRSISINYEKETLRYKEIASPVVNYLQN